MGKIKKPFAFVVDWGLFPDETLVVVGKISPEGVMHLAKKYPLKKSFLVELDTKLSTLPLDAPFFMTFEKSRSSMMHLLNYEDTWEFWETLIHELHHGVQMVLGENRCMEKEIEALAYSQENLFRKIRRNLQGIDPYKKVTL